MSMEQENYVDQLEYSHNDVNVRKLRFLFSQDEIKCYSTRAWLGEVGSLLSQKVGRKIT